MRRRPLRALLPLAIVALVGLTGSCSSDDDNGTNPPAETDLSGTYELVSFTQGGTTLGPPLATGTLVATQTTYSITITHPDPADPFGPPLTTIDEGTYSTDGNNWTQESSNTGLQGVGTFSLQGATLTVDVTTAGIEVLTVWNRTN
jgi:hypothetical protein